MAARSVCKAIIVGNLVKDSDTKFTANGTARTTFTVATNHRTNVDGEWKNEATYHNIVLWKSDNAASYLLKGKSVYIEGRISNRSYEQDGQRKYISEIIANDVILLGGGSREGGSVGAGPQDRPAQRKPSEDLEINDSDLPFVCSPMPGCGRWV